MSGNRHRQANGTRPQWRKAKRIGGKGDVHRLDAAYRARRAARKARRSKAPRPGAELSAFLKDHPIDISKAKVVKARLPVKRRMRGI